MKIAADSILSGTAAVEKGLGLLVSLVRDGGKTPFVGLSEELALPSSTAHRLLAVLKKQGLIVRVARGRYAGGAELVALAELSNLHEILARISRPILRKLARESGQAAHLGVLTGDMVTYLVKEQGRAAPIFTREGMKLEAYCSGIGKVLLSDLVAERLEDYLSGEPFVALTHRTLTDPEKLRREFARVRKNNFAVDNREVADDLHCIAVPVRDSRGRVVAAVSLSKLFDNSKRRKIGDDINALRKCVETIERRVWPARTDGDSKSSP